MARSCLASARAGVVLLALTLANCEALLPTCSLYGFCCKGIDPECGPWRACYCDDGCLARKDCCPDYHKFCKTVPGAPRPPLSFSDITYKSVTVEWNSPDHEGGDPVSYYLVEYRKDGNKNWNIITVKANQPRQATVTGLIAGATYSFRVVAYNSIGEGEPTTGQVTVAEDTHGCDDIFVGIGDKCIGYLGILTFYNAKKMCEERGATIVMPRSQEEWDDFVQSELYRGVSGGDPAFKFWLNCRMYSRAWYWILPPFPGTPVTWNRFDSAPTERKTTGLIGTGNGSAGPWLWSRQWEEQTAFCQK